MAQSEQTKDSGNAYRSCALDEKKPKRIEAALAHTYSAKDAQGLHSS